MNSFSRDQFMELMKECRVNRRLVRELRFNPENINWDILEVLAVGTRSDAEGVLMIQTTQQFILPYELSKGVKDSTTGRAKPIICDFCSTWQQGGKAGRITFRRKSDDHTFTYLCCADLRCSLHVRNLTPESALSRTHLHEDMNTDERIQRLIRKLTKIIETLEIDPTSLTKS